MDEEPIPTDGKDVGKERDAGAAQAMDGKTVTPEPISPWFLAEFSAWTMVGLARLLTWVNVPSVSTDQFVGRTSAFAPALVSAVNLRIGKIVRGRRDGVRQAPK
ncbi:MAG: hypothetical protein ACLQNE_05620 [Thermoguttaceae bacterium]